MVRHFDPRKRAERVRRRYDGTISDGLMAWARVITGHWKLFSLSEDEKTEWGPGVRVQMPMKSGQYENYALTVLTESELLAVKKVWDLAFELALPIVQVRDRIARDAAAEGNDAYSRSYRTVPECVIREGAIRAHRQGILDGSSHVSTGSGSGSDLDGDLRGSSDELADEVPADREASNDEPAAD